jgi:membrane protease YdiL (CAAX protease family)
MKKLYEKNEVTFAVLMIVIYVVGSSISEAVTAGIGVYKLVPAIFHVIFAVLIYGWISKNGLIEKYGLFAPKYKAAKAWFFLPLVIVACFGMVFGGKLQHSMPETVLHIVSMLCVGFLEEIIFRGFLFVGMARSNVLSAIIVSSITFGLGHIVNLLNGKAAFETIMQIIFAVTVGFTLVVLFYRGKSLLPCIIFHGVNNSLSAIEKSNEEIANILSMSKESFEMAVLAIFIVILAVYSTVMYKKLSADK